jgi:hypothetical protein
MPSNLGTDYVGSASGDLTSGIFKLTNMVRMVPEGGVLLLPTVAYHLTRIDIKVHWRDQELRR